MVQHNICLSLTAKFWYLLQFCLQGRVVPEYIKQLDSQGNQLCEYPFTCANAVSTDAVSCVVDGDNYESPASFFGRTGIQSPAGSSASSGTEFPEFAWTLSENSVLFRDGERLVPSEDYVDTFTREVVMTIVFFAPESQVWPHPSIPAVHDLPAVTGLV